MPDVEKFVVGARVKWSSQSGGYAKEKHGTVVEVVSPGQRPNRESFPDLYKSAGCGYGRDHESYVVAVDVGKTPGRSVRHYWPRTSALTTVEG